ncbi:beta-1,3-galactosyltransferase 1 isoform X2 [Rhinolophus sinicus]|uniref:beta-1,3-galactosyltransferase 1 isoform X2 n=1 Tax=Rhinolophus sinicus TaxID=89399 RepID=UPI003D7AE102
MFYTDTSTGVFIIRIPQFAKQQLFLARATPNLLIGLRLWFVPCTYSQKKTAGSVQQVGEHTVQLCGPSCWKNNSSPIKSEINITSLSEHTCSSTIFKRVKKKIFEAWNLPSGLGESSMNAEIQDCH